jgi:hypothetical protein
MEGCIVIKSFLAEYAFKIILGVLGTVVVTGAVWGLKSRYDEGKREEGRQEIRAQWDNANEVARLRTRSFDLQMGSNARKLDDARHAELKRLRVVVSDQQKALNETIDLFNDANRRTFGGLQQSESAACPGVSESGPSTACVDEVARLGGIAIRNYEAASSCADQVNGLHRWINSTVELFETLEIR